MDRFLYFGVKPSEITESEWTLVQIFKRHSGSHRLAFKDRGRWFEVKLDNKGLTLAINAIRQARMEYRYCIGGVVYEGKYPQRK